jgi:hypothetical protein
VRELAQAHTAETELAEHRAGAPAPTAPRVAANLELRLASCLVDQCFLGHLSLAYSSLLLGGLDRARRWRHADACAGGLGVGALLERETERVEQRLPPALSVAVVTIVMSMPRCVSILSTLISGNTVWSLRPKV